VADFWTHHRNARLVGPTLILLNERNERCVESMYRPSMMRDDPSYNFVFAPPETRLEGNWTSIISRFGSSNYYHWLNDALPRLALLDELPPDTRIIVSGELLQFQSDTLKLMGLFDRVRFTAESNLVLENYYFSSHTVITGCYDPYSLGFLRAQFLPKVTNEEGLPKRIYLYRRGKTRGIRNEEELIRLVTELGWTVIDPENFTFQEQLNLFAQVEAVCGFHGAAFTNLVWCKSGCKVLEIFPDNFLNACYENVARFVKCQYHFLVYPGDAFVFIDVNIDDVRKIIANW